MDAYQQLETLLDLVQELGITVRHMPGISAQSDQPGGSLTRVKDKEVLFLDGTASIADQLAVVASALAGRAELEDRYLSPQLRQCIEDNTNRGL